MGTKKLAAITLAAAISLSMSAAHDANACMHSGEWLPDTSMEEVLKAEHQVSQGKYDWAARNIAKSFPRIKKRRLNRSVLGDRALRVMAQVVVRTHGEMDLGSFLPGKSEAQRNENIEWSVHVLTGLSHQQPKDAVAQSSFAEALALVPAKRADAKRILSRLETKDLLATPQAFATLATLREDAGKGRPAFLAHPLRTLEDARARVARARCTSMAADDRMCVRYVAPPTKTPTKGA